MKRLISLLLALTMVLSMAPIEVFALSDESAFEPVQTEPVEDSPGEEEPVGPSAPEPWNDVLPPVSEETVVSEFTASEQSYFGGFESPSRAVMLPIDTGIGTMSTEIARETYYAPAGAASAVIGYISLPDEYNFNSAAKVFAVDSNGVIVANTSSAEGVYGNSATPKLYFTRKTNVGEEFSLRVYGGTLIDPKAYIIGTLKITDVPIIKSLYFEDSFSVSSPSYDIAIGFDNFQGDPATGYRVSLIDSKTLAEVASSDNGGGFRYIGNSYGGEVTLRYKVVRTAELDPTKQYSVKVERTDGGLLYSAVGSAAYSPYSAALRTGITPAAEGPVTISSVAVDSPNSSLIIKLENYTAGTAYNVSVSTSMLGVTGSGSYTPDSNGTITVPLTWVGDKVGLAETDTYYIQIYGSTGVLATYTKSPEVASTGPYQLSSYAYFYKNSDTPGDYTVLLQGGNNAMKAVYEAQNPVLTIKRIEADTGSGSITSNEVIGSFTVAKKSITSTTDYAGSTYDTYYMQGDLSIGRDLEPENGVYYGLYFENKFVCSAYLSRTASTAPTMTLMANNTAFTTGSRYIVADFNGIQRYKNVFWFVLDQLGLSFTTVYGGKDVTVNVRSSDGSIVMSAQSAGVAGSQYAGSQEAYAHTVYFDSSAASKLVPGEYYRFEVTDGSNTVTIMEDAEYSADKILPNSMSLTSSWQAIDEGVSEIAVYGLSSSNSYYMFGQYSGIRNYTCADLEAMPGTFVRIADNETVNASVIIKKDESGRNVPYIKTDKPLEFGEYKYYWGIGQGTVTVCSGKTYISGSVLNNVDNTVTTVTLTDNINLPDGNYTAYLCNGSDYSYEKVSMNRSGSDLSFTIPVSMRQNNVNILVAVFCDSRLLGISNFYYYTTGITQPNNPLTNAVPVSIGVYDPDTNLGGQRGLGMSIACSPDVMFSLMADKSIAEYRFADDRASLETAQYKRLETISVNEFGDIYSGIEFEYVLKNANGWNNLYFQFRDNTGRGTVVIPYSVFVTDTPNEVKITLAKIADGYIDENNEIIVRSSNDYIPVEIHSNSKMLLSSLNILTAVFDDGNGGEQQLSLYVTRGEVKKCTLHSDCYTVTLSFQVYGLVNNTIGGELKAIRIQYSSSAGEFTNYDIPAKLAESELPKESKYVAFTNLDNYYSTTYVNDSFVFKGSGAIPGSLVTAVFIPREGGDSVTLTANADGDGTFEMKVSESFKENTMYLTNLSCALGEETRGQTSNSYSILVDRTAPVLSDCGAVKNGESGEDGAIISWRSYDANNCFITLKRIDNGVEKVLLSRERTNDNSYIDTVPVADTTKYSISAEDAAGNKSAEITFTFADVVPPEAPANLRTVSAYTAVVIIEWDAAKDNVDIGKYHIYRRLSSESDYTQIGEVDGETLRYTDTNGLKENTQYYYKVSAEDTSGNVSEQSNQTYAKTGRYWLVADYTKWTPSAYITETDKLTIQGTVRLANSGLSSDYEFGKTQVFMHVSPGAEGEYEEKELSIISGSPDTRDFIFDFTGYEAGEYQIVFRAVDIYGVEKETSPRTFILSEDADAPTMSLSNYPGTVGPNTKFTMNVSLSDNVMLKDFTVTAKINGDGDNVDVFSTECTQKNVRNTLEIDMKLFAEKGIKLNTGDVVVLHFATHDTAGNEKAEDISLKINATAPGKVSGVSICPSSSDICLKWPHSSGMKPGYCYKIYRSASPDGGFKFIGQTGIYLTQDMVTNYYIDASIEEPGTYYYYVTAYGDYDNESEPSEIVSGMCYADKESPKIVSFAPAEGATARKTLVLSAAATDNYKLASAIFDYQKVGDRDWKRASGEIVIPENERSESYSFIYSWDISGLETGEYNVRVSVYDQSNKDEHYYGGSKNAPATETHKISVIKYDPPVKPTVSVETTNSTATLNWIYTGDLGAVEKFEISCCETDNGEFRLIKTVSPETFSYTLDLNSTMYYRVSAFDSLGGKGVSDAVAAIPKPNDTEKPVAVIMPEEIVGAVGGAISLSAESSSDNTGIVNYSWTFGDGETASGATVTHTYSAADNYNIVLTVTDAAGNENKDFVTANIVDVDAPGSEYVKVNLTVVDGAVGTSATVPGATLLFYSNEGVSAGRTYVTDENGKVSVVLKKAAYTVNCVVDGYSPATKTLDLTPYSGTLDQFFAISSGALVTGSLSSEPMTKEEIIQAGIDYNDPSNQQIEKFKVELRFDESLDLKYEIVLGYKNMHTGEFTRAEGGFHEMSSGNGSVGSMKFGAFPISEHFLLVIYGEAHWLKEMYKTQLFVFNANTVEHLENIKAELVLPKGLSLATMATGVQSAEQTLDRMDTMNGSVFTWYVRGDVAGDYYLTANVNAVSVEGALSTDISETYKTSSPIHVYAGNALKMTIHAPNIAKREEVYSVVFDLENVSDKPIYDFVFSIMGVEQHKIITSNGVTTGDILIDSTDHSLNVPISVFEPGGKISVSVNSTIMFNGMNELIRLNPVSTFVDPAYVLTDVSKVTLEGSTTSIPYVVNIEKVEKTGFLDGTPFEGLISYFGVEDVRGYKPEFNPKDMAIELLGWVLDIPMLSETVTMMSLMETEGEYSYEVSIENGKAGANTVTDNVIEIECADTANSYVDAAAGSLKLTGGDVMLKALKEGKTNVTITVVPTVEGEAPRTYELAITVTNGEVKAEIAAEPTGIAAVANRAAASTAFADHTAAAEALEELTQKARAEMKKNPYEWFNSVYALDSGTADAHVGLRAEDLKNAADRAFVTHIGIESENAEILLDRGVIDVLVGSDMAVDSVKLSAAEAEERFGTAYKDCPTYEFTLTSGSSEVKELGGKATVSVPYTFKEGATENSIVVQHIDDQGKAEQIDFVYKNGRVVFETESLSCFRILNVGDRLPDSELVISGSTYLGGVLTASVEGVKEGELVYKWYRGGNFDAPIAVGASYTVTEADSEQKLTVRAYGTGDPYAENLYLSAEIEIPDLERTFIKGDVNNDGAVNVLDVVLLADYCTNGNSSEGMDVFIEPAAYVNDDSSIDVLDVIVLIDLISNE